MGGCLSAFRYRKLDPVKKQKIIDETEKRVKAKMSILSGKEQKYDHEIYTIQSNINEIIKNQHNYPPGQAKAKAMTWMKKKNNLRSALKVLQLQIDAEHKKGLEILEMANNHEMLIHDMAISKQLRSLRIPSHIVKKQMESNSRQRDEVHDFNQEMIEHAHDVEGCGEPGLTEDEMSEELDNMFTTAIEKEQTSAIQEMKLPNLSLKQVTPVPQVQFPSRFNVDVVRT